MLLPECGDIAVREIRPVHYNEPGLVSDEFVYIRVAAGLRDPRVDNLGSGVAEREIFFDHSLRFCHMARKPVYVLGLKFHQRFMNPRRSTGWTIMIALPSIRRSSSIPIRLSLESLDMFLLSPITNIEPSGTVWGPTKSSLL